MGDPGLQREAGVAAVAVAVGNLAYSFSFVVVSRVSPRPGATLSAIFLLVGGLLTVLVLAGVYDRFRNTRPTLALLAVVLGTAGGLGAAIHGGYDLANLIHPPSSPAPNTANPVDPRGLLTFGVTGLAVLVLARLLDGGLRLMGQVAAVLLVLVYLARLIVLSSSSPLVLLPAALAGFVATPVFFAWLGSWLLRTADQSG